MYLPTVLFRTYVENNSPRKRSKKWKCPLDQFKYTVDIGYSDVLDIVMYWI